MNKIFIDTESWADQLCELAYVVVDENFNIIEEESIKIRPQNMAANNTFSLPYHTSEIAQFPILDVQQIHDVLYNKGEIYGFSFANDLRQLRKDAYEAFNTENIKYFEVQHQIDGVKSKLTSLLEYYGISFKQCHSALDDAKATLELFKHSNIAREVSAPIVPVKVKQKKKKVPNSNNSKEDRIEIFRAIINRTTFEKIDYIIDTKVFQKLKSFGHVKGFAKKCLKHNKGVLIFNSKTLELNMNTYLELYPGVKILDKISEIKKETSRLN